MEKKPTFRWYFSRDLDRLRHTEIPSVIQSSTSCRISDFAWTPSRYNWGSLKIQPFSYTTVAPLTYSWGTTFISHIDTHTAYLITSPCQSFIPLKDLNSAIIPGTLYTEHNYILFCFSLQESFENWFQPTGGALKRWSRFHDKICSVSAYRLQVIVILVSLRLPFHKNTHHFYKRIKLPNQILKPMQLYQVDLISTRKYKKNNKPSINYNDFYNYQSYNSVILILQVFPDFFVTFCITDTSEATLASNIIIKACICHFCFYCRYKTPARFILNLRKETK